MPGHCWDARSSVSGWIGLVFAFSRGSLEYARSAAGWARVTGWLEVVAVEVGSHCFLLEELPPSVEKT